MVEPLRGHACRHERRRDTSGRHARSGKHRQPGGFGIEGTTNWPNYTLTLTDIGGGIKPCGANASDIIGATQRIRNIVQKLRGLMPGDKDFADGKSAPPLANEKGYQLALDAARFVAICIAPPTAASGASASSINDVTMNGQLVVPHAPQLNKFNSWRPLCQRTDLYNLIQDKNEFVKISPPGAQAVIFAQLGLVTMWQLFGWCEASIRSEMLFVQNDPVNMFKPIADNFHGSIWDCWPWDSGCASNDFNHQYRDAMYKVYRTYYALFRKSPDQSAVDFGMLGWDPNTKFKQWLPSYDTTNAVLPSTFNIPAEARKYYINKIVPNDKSQTWAPPSGPTGPGVPHAANRSLNNMLFAFGVLGSLGRRRSRRRKSASRTLLIAGFLVMNVLFGMSFAGCDNYCDVHNKMDRFICETHCPCGNHSHEIDLSKNDDPDCPLLSLRRSEIIDQLTTVPIDVGSALTEAEQEFGTQPIANDSTGDSATPGGPPPPGVGGTPTGDTNAKNGSNGHTGNGAVGGGDASAGNMITMPTAKKPQTASVGGGSAPGAPMGTSGPTTSSGGSSSGMGPLASMPDLAGDEAAAAAAAAAARANAVTGRKMDFETGGGGPMGSRGGRSLASGIDGVDGTGVKEDDYLNGVGSIGTSMSLFDVVSKRYSSWDNEMKSRKPPAPLNLPTKN